MSIFGFLSSKKDKVNKYKLNNPEDIYKILDDMNKSNKSEKLKFVVNELCSNVFENDETAEIIFQDKLVHVLIDAKTLTEEKKYGIKLAILLAKAFQLESNAIKLKNTESYGGLGMKMVLGSGFDIEYKDCGDWFSIIAYQG